MHVDIARHLEVNEFLAEVTGGEDVVRGDRAILQDVLLMIDVVEEKVERGDALNQTSFQVLPFAGGDDSRNHVEREDTFGSLGIAVDIEGDALP